MITLGYICYAISMFGFAYGVFGLVKTAMTRKGRQN